LTQRTSPSMKSQVAPRNTRAVLTIEGLCARPKGFSLHDLDNIHSDYQVDDVSKVEEKLQGRAVRLRGLVDQVGPGFQAKFLTVESEDGAFTACLPMEEMKRTALVIYGLKGNKPLEREQGGPVRFVVPFYGDKCANVKSVARLVLSEEPRPDTRPSNQAEHAALHAKDGQADG
jgi:DMSO/TMAO reductase YedYZ molybdopterin-dependent catalytic subunit